MPPIYAPPVLHVLHVPKADKRRTAAVLALIEEHGAGVCLHEDPHRAGVVQNWAAAMACIDRHKDESDWHFVVQDDMHPFRGWQQHLERACVNSPAPVLGLSWHGAFRAAAHAAGRPYLAGKWLLIGEAVAYHRSVFPSMTRWAARVRDVGYEHDDMAVNVWLNQRGHLSPVVARSIFGMLDVRSLLGHPSRADRSTVSIEEPGADYQFRPSTHRADYTANRSEEARLMEMLEGRPRTLKVREGIL